MTYFRGVGQKYRNIFVWFFFGSNEDIQKLFWNQLTFHKQLVFSQSASNIDFVLKSIFCMVIENFVRERGKNVSLKKKCVLPRDDTKLPQLQVIRTFFFFYNRNKWPCTIRFLTNWGTKERTKHLKVVKVNVQHYRIYRLVVNNFQVMWYLIPFHIYWNPGLATFQVPHDTQNWSLNRTLWTSKLKSKLQVLFYKSISGP